MPLYDFKCNKHGKFEDLVSFSTTTLPCPKCNEPAVKMICMPARTSGRWGDCGGTHGVNGTYDRGLGATYHNSMEREAIMKAKGLISLDDVGGDNFVSDRFASEIKIKAEQDAILESYHTKVADYGGTEQAQIKAIEELFPARECLDNVGNTATINANPWTGQTTMSEEI